MKRILDGLNRLKEAAQGPRSASNTLPADLYGPAVQSFPSKSHLPPRALARAMQAPQGGVVIVVSSKERSSPAAGVALSALPRPSDLTAITIDPILVDRYRAFLERLNRPCDGVVAADVEFFLRLDDHDHPSIEARLLACLLHLDDALLDRIITAALPISRASEAWTYCRQNGEASGWVMRLLKQRWPCEGGWPNDPNVAVQLLLRMEETIGTPEWRAFASGRVPPAVLLEFGFARWSMTASDQHVACLDFDRDWAIVIHWDPNYTFLPIVWGFVAKDDLVGRLVRLSFKIGGAPFLSRCTFDFEDPLAPGDQLLFDLLKTEEDALSLSRPLDLLLHVGPTSRGLLAQVGVARLREILSSIAATQKAVDGDFDPQRLIARFGEPTSESDLMRVESKLRGGSNPEC